MCYYLKFQIKYEYSWNQIRNLTSLLIFCFFSFFTGIGYSIKAARLILLKFGSQQITSMHRWMEDPVRRAKEFRSGAVAEGVYRQCQSKRMIICKCLLRTVSLETRSKKGMTNWKDGDKETVFVSHGELDINSEISYFFKPGMAQGKL